jgi:hypothetical protein
MIGHALTIFIAFAHRLGAVSPDVCPKSFLIDRSSIFHLLRSYVLPRSASQTLLFRVFRTPQQSPNRHSKHRGFSETASFK